MVVVGPVDWSRFIPHICAGFRLIVNILNIWGWLWLISVSLRRSFVVVKFDYRFFIIVSPGDWCGLVLLELLSWFTPVVVLDNWGWLFIKTEGSC
jgi:hypothetical protein